MGKRCVYCLEYTANITVDHVFPRSWYLNNTPKNTKKWTVPSCLNCNNYYSKIEEDLFTKLGLCLHINNDDEKNIQNRILRSTKPNQGKNAKDTFSRQKKKERLLKQITRFKEIPSYGILPGFSPKTKIILPEYSTIKIDPNLLKEFGIKLTKGFTYIFYDVFIDDRNKIDVIIPNDISIKFINDLFQNHGEKHNNLGNSIIIEKVKADDDHKISILYHFNIWNRLKMYSHVEIIK